VTHGEGWRLNATRVSLGPAGGEVKGLKLVMPGLTAQSEPGLVVRVDPLRWLWGKRELRVVEAKVNGVSLTLAPAERGGAATPFTGVLSALQAPLPWSIGHVRVDAEMDFRGWADASLRERLKAGCRLTTFPERSTETTV